MRLKYAIRIGDPKSPGLGYLGRTTGTSHLTRDDVIAAKYTKGADAMQAALRELDKQAWNIRGKYLGTVSGRDIRQAVSVLVAFVLEDYARTADTPGAKCRCGGRCEVLDAKASQHKGVQVMKPCSRCKGTGLKPLMHSRVHHALLRHISVSQPTYSRRWKPFYDELLSWCYEQENTAERCYNDVAGLRPQTTETGKKSKEFKK